MTPLDVIISLPYDHHTPIKSLVARQQRTNLYMYIMSHYTSKCVHVYMYKH